MGEPGLQMLYRANQPWCAGRRVKPPYITLFLGEMCSKVQLLKLSSGAQLPRTLERLRVLIFLECWVFLPQQICFAEGSWLWLALGQEEHALCCGCQNARITAQVGGGCSQNSWGPPGRRQAHIRLWASARLPSACSHLGQLLLFCLNQLPPFVAHIWPLHWKWAGGMFCVGDFQGSHLPQVGQPAHPLL